MSDARVVSAGGEWDDSVVVESEVAVSHRREVLLALLASALLILAGLGGAYFLDSLQQRDVTVRALEARISTLESANSALADEVSSLGRERAQLLTTRETLTRERDGLISERTSLVAERATMTEELNSLAATRDRVAADRDRLNGRLSDLDRQLADTQGKLDASESEVSAARLESARQVERAKAAEAKTQQSGQVLSVDASMSREAATFLSLFQDLDSAYLAADPVAFDSALAKCRASAARLDSLRRQRDRLASQLGL